MIKRNDNLVFYGPLDNKLHVCIDLTKFCNFRCHYCHLKKNTNLVDPKLNLKEMIDFILNLKDEKYSIIITGGEPSLHPDILNMISYLIYQSYNKNKDITISLFSNMSKPIEFYEKYFKLNPGYSNVQLSLFPSFHREFINIYTFLDKLKYLKSKNFNLNPFAFMVHNIDCITLLNSIKNDLDELLFRIDPLFNGTIDYTKIDPEIKETRIESKNYSIYFENNEYVYSNNKTKNICFRGFICSVFKKQVVIHPDGSISPCQLFFYKKNLNVSIKNSKEWIDNNEYVLCPVKKCTCGEHIPKFDPFHFKKLKNINEEYILNNIKKKIT